MRSQSSKVKAVLALVTALTMLPVAAPDAGAVDLPAPATDVRVGTQVAQRLADHPTAPVMIELAVPWQVEQLLGADGAKAQRSLIRETTDDLLDQLGAQAELNHRFRTVPWLAVDLTAEGLARLRRSPLAVRVVLDRLHAPTLEQSVPLIGGDLVDAAGVDGLGYAVAIVDSGVEKDHPMLKGRVTGEACFTTDTSCPNGKNSMTGSGASRPCGHMRCDHGTHVASIAAGAKPAALAVRRAGVADRATVVGMQVFEVRTDPDDCDGQSSCIRSTDSTTLSALESVYVSRNNFKFAAVNMSLGSGQYAGACDDDPRAGMVAQLKQVGIAVVAAAGNNGYESHMAAPACITNVVSVANGRKDGQSLSESTNISPTTDLIAPGAGILAATVNGGYTTKSGTSMAAPHVAGGFAVLKQLRPGETVSQLFKRMSSTGRPVTDWRNDDVLPPVTKPYVNLLAASGIPQVSIAKGGYAVSEGGGTLTIRVTRSGDLNLASKVQVHAIEPPQGPKATLKVDFDGLPVTVPFAAGEASKDVPIRIFDDTDAEADEVFQVELRKPSMAYLARDAKPSKVTIVENDVVVAVHDTTVTEGKGVVSVSATRAGDLDATPTLKWQAIPGSAGSPADFSPVEGTFTFAAGATTAKTKITIVNDTEPELTETFTVKVVDWPNNVYLHRGSATVSIFDDDSGFQLDKSTYDVKEGKPTTMTVHRLGGTSGSASVTLSRTGGGTASLRDYTISPSTVTFAPGESKKTVELVAVDDAWVEGQEQGFIELKAATEGYTIEGMNPAGVRIHDNDIGYVVQPVAPVPENATSVAVWVVREGDQTVKSSVDYSTVSGTAVSGQDFGFTSGRLNFHADSNKQIVEVPLLDDGLGEGDEQFGFRLLNPSPGVLLTGEQTVTIAENDRGVRFRTASMRATESDELIPVHVDRVGPADGTLQVDYTIRPGTAGEDDIGVDSGTLVFADGETSRVIDVGVRDDDVTEGDETFTVGLSNPVGGVVGTVPAVEVAIRDNERGVQLVSGKVTVDEAAGRATVLVRRTGPIDSVPVSFNWGTVAGSAAAGADFTERRGHATFSGRQETKTLTIAILADDEAEGIESFSVVIGDPSEGAAIVADPAATVVEIRDDDTGFRFARSAYTAYESARRPTSAVVTRYGDTTRPASVWVVSESGDAETGDDFTAVEKRLDFAAGATSMSVTLPVIDDAAVEPDETFTLELFDPSPGGQLGDPSTTTVTIVSNETGYRFTQSAVRTTEGSVVTLTVERVGPAVDGSVAWGMRSGSATVGSDVTEDRGVLSFPPDTSTQTISFTIRYDRIMEPEERFYVYLAQPSPGTGLGNPDLVEVVIEAG